MTAKIHLLQAKSFSPNITTDTNSKKFVMKRTSSNKEMKENFHNHYSIGRNLITQKIIMLLKIKIKS